MNSYLDGQVKRYTNRVVTLWYRPPELLLGERNYTSSIDLWGAGCIMAELWKRSPIMQGNTEQQQLVLISQLCGSIDTSVWPDADKLELFTKLSLPIGLKRRVTEEMKRFIDEPNALDLLDCLLTLDPKNRIDSDEALNHDFFWTEPLPTSFSLEKHLKNMYELTALPRRNHAAHQSNQQQRPVVNSQQHYDRVY